MNANRPIRILGTGHALPRREILSSELDQQLELKSGTVESIGGVRKRHFADRYETAASLGAEAATKALAAAGLNWADIDVLISANGTMDQGMPCNAALLHRELGLSASGIPAFDINASCLSFLVALDTLAWPIVAGHYQRVLIVSSDLASCGLDWRVLESSAIFGDGAAAAVLGRCEPGGSEILAAGLRTYSAGTDFCRIPAGGSRFHPTRIEGSFDALTTFRMDGKSVFKLAAAHLPDFVDELLAQARITRQALDWVVPHQASHLALAHLTKRLGFSAQRVVNIFPEHGNQVAASLPTALDIAIRDQRIQRGQTLLLLGTGAGLSLGGLVVRY